MFQFEGATWYSGKRCNRPTEPYELFLGVPTRCEILILKNLPPFRWESRIPGIEGTSVPCHYHVLHLDKRLIKRGIGVDDLEAWQWNVGVSGWDGDLFPQTLPIFPSQENITFQLCHMYSRADKSVGYATPAYMADHACNSTELRFDIFSVNLDASIDKLNVTGRDFGLQRRAWKMLLGSCLWCFWYPIYNGFIVQRGAGSNWPNVDVVVGATSNHHSQAKLSEHSSDSEVFSCFPFSLYFFLQVVLLFCFDTMVLVRGYTRCYIFRFNFFGDSCHSWNFGTFIHVLVP